MKKTNTLDVYAYDYDVIGFEKIGFCCVKRDISYIKIILGAIYNIIIGYNTTR